MNQRTLRGLELDKVLSRLAAETATVVGQELALATRPEVELSVVRARQQETSEARALLDRGKELNLGGVRDVRRAVRLAAAGGVLEPSELGAVADTLRAASRLRAFFFGRAGVSQDVPALAAVAGRLEAPEGLLEAIERAITDRGEVADRASAELGRIRQRIRQTQQRIKDRLEGMVRSPEVARHLQEPLVTLRAGRYVLPVRQEARAQVPGVVHDQSSSGQTLFVEPMAVVELNNDLRQLERAQEEEVRRVLAELSARVGDAATALGATLEALGRLDLAAAKAKLSRRMDAVEPCLNELGVIRLQAARHPLLAGDVVPIAVALGDQFDALIITGPNTGGKTVTLKTVGLLTLMAQAGLHVPAAPGSEVCVFRQVFCDIGDEQSIEQSLSTFSAHMTNIVEIVGAVEPEASGGGFRTLVLLDEIGAGTDPMEGAALAMALVDHLTDLGVRLVATTHYPELKSYAFVRERVENASVEFDLETLRPTYRLVVGLPGRSNALEIAARLGLDRSIIDRARRHLNQARTEVESLVAAVEQARSTAEREAALAARARQEAEALLERARREWAALERSKEERLQKARYEAEQVAARARREAEAALEELRRGIRELEDLVTAREAERALTRTAEAVRGRLREMAEGQAGGEAASEAGPDLRAGPLRRDDVAPGDPVWVQSLGQVAEVVSGPDADGRVTVQLGALRATVGLEGLRRARTAARQAERLPEERPPRQAGLDPRRVAAFSPELHLRGLTADEALTRLDKYLDDAALAGVPAVRIVHGKGTGVLRQAVSRFLKGHPLVAGFRPGEPGEGGAGVTVVRLAGHDGQAPPGEAPEVSGDEI